MQLYTVDELKSLLSFHLEHDDADSIATKSSYRDSSCVECYKNNVNTVYQQVERPILTRQDKQNLRIVLLLIISVPYYTCFTNLDWHYFMVPFTNWTLLMTTVGVAMSIYAGYDGKRYGRHALCALNSPFVDDSVRHSQSNTFCLQAVHHFILNMALIMNSIVVPVYWTLLHKR